MFNVTETDNKISINNATINVLSLLICTIEKKNLYKQSYEFKSMIFAISSLFAIQQCVNFL